MRRAAERRVGGGQGRGQRDKKTKRDKQTKGHGQARAVPHHSPVRAPRPPPSPARISAAAAILRLPPQGHRNGKERAGSGLRCSATSLSGREGLPGARPGSAGAPASCGALPGPAEVPPDPPRPVPSRPQPPPALPGFCSVPRLSVKASTEPSNSSGFICLVRRRPGCCPAPRSGLCPSP